MRIEAGHRAGEGKRRGQGAAYLRGVLQDVAETEAEGLKGVEQGGKLPEADEAAGVFATCGVGEV